MTRPVLHVDPMDSGTCCPCEVCTTAPPPNEVSCNDFTYALAPVDACEECGSAATWNYIDACTNHYVCDAHAPVDKDAYTVVVRVTKYQITGFTPQALERFAARQQTMQVC